MRLVAACLSHLIERVAAHENVVHVVQHIGLVHLLLYFSHEPVELKIKIKLLSAVMYF